MPDYPLPIVVNATHSPFDIYCGRLESYARVAHRQIAHPEDTLIRSLQTIGAGGTFGNIYHLHDERQREQIVARHKVWLWKQISTDPKYAQTLRLLSGLKLGCFCAPKLCHVSNIVAYIAWLNAGSPPKQRAG